MAPPVPLAIDPRKRSRWNDESPEHNGTSNNRPSKISKFLKDGHAGPLTRQLEREFKALQNETAESRYTHRPNLAKRLNKARDRMTNPTQTNAATRSANGDNDMETSSEQNNSDKEKIIADWHLPKKTISQKNAQKQLKETELDNKYALLGNDASLTASAQDNLTQSDVTASQENGAKTASTDKKIRIPPIYCNNTSTKNLIAEIKNKTGITNFIVNQTNNNETTIHTYSIADYQAAKKCLQEAQIAFFTYTPQTQRKKLFVLKGINNEYNADEVKAELISKQISDLQIEKVDKLIFNKETPDRFHFLVQISSESKAQNLTAIKNLAYQSIKWEPYRKNKVFQCYKCQRVGHSSANCNLGYRCVKCTESHEPGKCSRNEASASPTGKPVCVNCKESHPANYRGCPYLKLAQKVSSDIKADRRTARLDRSARGRSGPIRSTTLSTVGHATRRAAHIDQQRYDADFPPTPWPQHPTTRPFPHPATDRQHHTQPNEDIHTMLSSFRNDILTSIQQQNNVFANFSNQIYSKISENSAKIDFLFNNLKLKWE